MPQEGFLEEVDDFAHGTRGQKAGQIGNLIAIVIITISHLSKKPVVGGCPVSPVQFPVKYWITGVFKCSSVSLADL